MRVADCDFRLGNATDDEAAVVIFDGGNNARIEACQFEGFATRYKIPAGVMVNGHGREAAGSGNSPLLQHNRLEGDFVTNTDDGTVWMLERDDSWIQVA